MKNKQIKLDFSKFGEIDSNTFSEEAKKTKELIQEMKKEGL